MTAKEYLKQAYLLDKQIQVEVKELEQLRGTNPNRNLEAPFIKTIEKIWEYEQKIDAKINRLVDLRAAINAAIESMENPEERLLLKYRYLKNESWEDISYELNVSYRTVHRIHASALNNCFRVGKRWMHCHIEATYRVNILAVQHLFRTVRCIVRNISLYIQRTELMQQSVAMVPSGSVREGSS